MTRAVILVERGFQDEEYVYAYYRMLEDGWDVDVASPDGKTAHGKFGVPARPNANVGMLVASAYDAVVIPGGFECPDRLRMREDVQHFVRESHKAGAVIGAICHGPWVLISAGVVRGRNMAGYPSIWPDLENAGALVDPDERVVADGNLVTAQHYLYNGPFMKKVIERVNATRCWDERHSSVF